MRFTLKTQGASEPFQPQQRFERWQSMPVLLQIVLDEILTASETNSQETILSPGPQTLGKRPGDWNGTEANHAETVPT